MATPKDPQAQPSPPPVQAQVVQTTPRSFPIVGMGASAGGLAAFEAFFSAMPPDREPGMAFVLVQHLAPGHKSLLPELIRRYTHMPVFEVEDGIAVQNNCVYIMPPSHDMAYLGGTLQLLSPIKPRGHRLPIDYFLRSLAADQHERAIGVILSGTGSDGTLGVRAIKDAGGMVMVQNPESTEFDGMPKSAMATGLADYELPPAEMPAQLISYASLVTGRLAQVTPVFNALDEGAMNKIFALIRDQTGHDFSGYKPSTIHRRIERRVAVQQVETLEAYVHYLQQTPAEVETLFRELLIGVTNFFRDPEVFESLEELVIPRLFASKSTTNGVVRVWVTGCSTGEEAYSIAILLQERMETLRQSYTVQVFATDIDSRAIAVARLGLYPAGIAAFVSAQRLARFFTMEPGAGGYRIHKGIRDMLVFSEQDLIRDPPFSRLDLICCRNLLIYLGADLQQKIIPLFHYALNPGGALLLGTSEGIGDFNELFTALDRKAKMYQRKEDLHGLQRASLSRTLLKRPPLTALEAAVPRLAIKSDSHARLPLRELTEQALLAQIAPVGALVNAQGDILYLHGRTGMYLELSPGEAGVNNILKMAREGLRQDLSVGLRKCATSDSPVRLENLRVKTNGHSTLVNLSVRPVSTGGPSDGGDFNGDGQLLSPSEALFLVVLEEAHDQTPELTLQAAQRLAKEVATDGAGTSEQQTQANAKAQVRISALMDELRSKEAYIQSTHEQLESSNEELKSSNEEMQSVNEELQSTNEELETSKEELQSLNEELATVNIELHTKVSDLSRVNNDMNNLLAGTGIATVFVDTQLCILRFTPTATQIINLIQSDIGRPVGHIVSNLLGYDSLVADAQAVLDTLVPQDTQVRTRVGGWFTMRIRAYRTLDNVIEGVVITFSDITEMKRIEVALEGANKLARLAVVVRDASDAITVQDLDGATLAWNPGAVRLYGWSEAEALAMNVRERIPQDLREQALAGVIQLSRAEVLEPCRTRRLTQAGTMLDIWLTATALVNERGQMYAVATTERATPSGLLPADEVSP
jgi:two-component system CheB/CheR fusion protein